MHCIWRRLFRRGLEFHVCTINKSAHTIKHEVCKSNIKTVPNPPYSPDLNFWLFLKLRGCRYETIEEMKEAVTKVIDTLTQEEFHGALPKLLERYNKCIAAGEDYFEGDQSFMCVLSINVPIRKKVWKLIVCTSNF